MMRSTLPVHRHLFLACCAVLLLSACNKQGPEAPAVNAGADAGLADAGVSRESAEPELPPPPPMPEARPNALAVGSALGSNGGVQAPKPVYSLADTVYASIPTQEASPGDAVTVWWTRDGGTTDKEETKQVEAGAEFVNFAFSQADGMQAGGYNVQVDVNDVPVGIVDFTVE